MVDLAELGMEKKLVWETEGEMSRIVSEGCKTGLSWKERSPET